MQLPTISTIPKMDETDFTHNIYKFRRSETINIKLHTDRHRAVVRFRRVKELVRSRSDWSRVQVQGICKVDRKRTGEYQTHQEQCCCRKQTISWSCGRDRRTPYHASNRHRSLRNHHDRGAHTTSHPTRHRTLRRYPEFRCG